MNTSDDMKKHINNNTYNNKNFAYLIIEPKELFYIINNLNNRVYNKNGFRKGGLLAVTDISTRLYKYNYML